MKLYWSDMNYSQGTLGKRTTYLGNPLVNKD